MARAFLRPALCVLTLLAAPAGIAWAAEPAGCEGLPEVRDPWRGREAAIAAHAQVPPACLRALVRTCNEAAAEAFLDAGSAAVCSIRYEALLRHGFGGDFSALLAWWRQGR